MYTVENNFRQRGIAAAKQLESNRRVPPYCVFFLLLRRGYGRLRLKKILACSLAVFLRAYGVVLFR